MEVEKLIDNLIAINGIKFGNFKLKSGQQSPIYIDLRLLVSYPNILSSVANLLWNKVANHEKFDLICGVPYTALPIATCISVANNRPMIMKRKEAKSYGTKQMVEGNFTIGQNVLIVEDVITSGASILETVISVKESGLVVTDVVVLLDRQQGGIENLAECGINVHYILTVDDIIKKLCESNKLCTIEAEKIRNWMSDNRSNLDAHILTEYQLLLNKPKNFSYEQKLSLTTNNLTKKLLSIMIAKKSNVCVALDFTHSNEIFNLIELIGEHVAVIKLHVDIIEDFVYDQFVEKLIKLSKTYNFIIFEDRKFADIGNTVMKQYSNGVYRISNWAHLVNAHPLVGPGIVKCLRKSLTDNANVEERGCLLVAELSCDGNLITKPYTQAANKMAIENDDFVVGFISQSRVCTNQALLHFTPGVHIAAINDSHDQRYITPEMAIIERGADIIIVGRGITEAEDPVKAVIEYKQRGYAAYQSQI